MFRYGDFEFEDKDVYTGVLWISVLLLSFSYKWWKGLFFSKELDDIPGPTTVPIFGNSLMFVGSCHDILVRMCELAEKYNGLFKLQVGPRRVVCISRPEDLEIYMTNKNCIDRGDLYQAFEPAIGTGIFTSNGELWRKNRKLIAPFLGSPVLKDFVKIFRENSLILVDKLRKEAGHGSFNMFTYVRNCSVNFILQTAMGTTVNVQNGEMTVLLVNAERLMDIMYQRIYKIWLYSDFIFALTEQGKIHNESIKMMRRFSEQSIQQMKRERQLERQQMATLGIEEKTKKKPCLLNMLLDLNDAEKDTFTDEQLNDELMTMVVTGYETTAATTCFILMMLGLHQDVQDKVYEEVIKLQNTLGRPFEYQDLASLEYMEIVIKETLRLFPVGPVIGRKANSDIKFSTFTAPKNTYLSVVTMRTHRDPQIWKDPNKFNPDNFLPENVAKRHPYSYIPFSAGPRGCVGQKYGMASMKVMVSTIIQNYRIHCDYKMEDIKLKSEATLKVVGGFNMRVELRK